MKILHILNDGPNKLASSIINVQAAEHEVKIIDLLKKTSSYEHIVDEIEACDKVISW